MRLLIVEDDPLQVKLIRKVLDDGTCEFSEAHTGEAALELLDQTPVDLILLDLVLPGMSGLDVCRKIMSRGDMRHIPVIFLSSSSQMELITEGLRSGAQDYITKGADPIEIVARIRAHLSHVRTTGRILEFEKQLSMGHLVTGLCHEILNPLTILSGNLELLASRLEESEVREWATESHRLCFDISRKITCLKQYTDGTHRPFEATQLAELVRHALEFVDLSRQERERHVKVEQVLDDVPPIHAQRERLSQAIINVLLNALHVAPGGSRVMISIGRDRDLGYVRIRDQGGGIPGEFLPRIFDPFFTTRPEKDCLGLGLAVTQKILLEHGGRIDVESEPGRGSAFTLLVPLSRGHAAAPAIVEES